MEEISSTAEVRSSKTLWYGMFFSPVVWSLHFLIGYFLSEAACMTNFLGFRIVGMGALFFILVVLTIIAMAAIGWNAWWSYRSWQHYAALDPDEEFPLQAYDRDEFLALGGLLLSGLTFLGLVLTLYPILVLRPCV